MKKILIALLLPLFLGGCFGWNTPPDGSYRGLCESVFPHHNKFSEVFLEHEKKIPDEVKISYDHFDLALSTGCSGS